MSGGIMNMEKALFALVAVGTVLVVLSSYSGSVRFLTVLGGSMSPTFNVGDMVVAVAAPPDAIKSGDILSYQKEGTIVTHRVVDSSEYGFTVKGDANEDPDPEKVLPGQVIGKVQLSLPLMGYVLNFARSKFGLLIFVIIPGMLIMASEVKKLLQYKKSGAKGNVTLPPVSIFMIFSMMLASGFFATGAYFSDVETSTGNVVALAPNACVFTNVTKYWTDTCFNQMDGPSYNSTFYLVYHNDTGKVTATNPGGFYIYVNISNTPNITSLQITDDILGNILSSGDFKSKGANSFQVALSSGEAITNKFDWSFDGTTLSATLKPGKTIKSDKWIWAVFHIEYAIESLTWDEAVSLFPHLYTNRLTVTINGQTYQGGANLTARIKMVGKDFGKYGYSSVDLMKAPEPPTPPAIESLSVILDETNTTDPIPNETTGNSTFEMNQSDIGAEANITIEDNSTLTGGNSTNATEEPVLNETTEPILNETATVYPMVAGYNTFLVPDTWATNAFQLASDYPLMLDIAYIDAENNTITYVAGDPVEQSFDITAGMTITINALEPFDIV